jgi:hypothetical protein
MTPPNPLEPAPPVQENKQPADTLAVKPAKGIHQTPAYVAEEANRSFVLGDGVTMREDR